MLSPGGSGYFTCVQNAKSFSFWSTHVTQSKWWQGSASMYCTVCTVLYCIYCTVMYVLYCTVLYVLYCTVMYVLYCTVCTVL